MKKFAFVFALSFAPCVFGVDGTVLINQSTINTSGGFPYRITQPGSYKLTGNIVAPLNQIAIQISAGYVLLDLNGFNVQCSADQTQSLFAFACISDGTTPTVNVTIRNGTVLATASAASFNFSRIACVGFQFSSRTTIEDLRLQANVTNFGAWGYALGVDSIIRHNILTGEGPNTSCPSLIVENINTSVGAASSGIGCVGVNNIGPFGIF
jgi:hypothetical protein